MSLDLGRDSLDTSSTPKAAVANPSTIQNNGPESSSAPASDGDTRSRLDRVLQSDIGTNTLLIRLKQSISSAREFSNFLKERAVLEERHGSGISRLTRNTHDLVGRPENRQGSFALNYREVGTIHEQMVRNSEEFAHSLLSMSDDLQEVALRCERGRKQWKHTGLEAEQRAQDADAALEKAKSRYFSLADQYDRVRTGERQGGKFGLKGPKSAQQQEESLLSKAENADQEYRARVEAAQSQRHELLTSSRPQAVRELQNLIMECDSAVSMQLQKFATLNEKLILSNGLCVSPLKNQESGTPPTSRSLREVAQAINNQKDFEDFVLSHGNNVGPTPPEIKYEKHAALVAPTYHQHQHQPSLTTSSNNFNTAPARVDTGFGNTADSFGPSGQTSGVAPAQPPTYQNSQGNMQSPAVTSAPQLPHIGSLAIGGGNNMNNSRPRSPPNRNSNDAATFSGPQQHRPGQQSFSSPGNFSPTSSVNQQVTEGYGHMPSMGSGLGSGPGPGQAPGFGSGRGRGQPPMGNMPSQTGPSGQMPYPHSARGPSLGHPSDFRPNGRGQPTGPDQLMYSSEGRGLPSQTGQFGTNPQRAQNHPMAGPGYSKFNANNAGDSMGNNNNIGNAPLSGNPLNAARGAGNRPNLPPLRPVFGVPLDELFRRDGNAVPTIVYQCVKAVDHFGLQTEGLYRVSGSAQHIMELQTLFDHDSSQVDFRTPASFYNDIASVTTLLKYFLRDLPDPLLTSAQYNSFIQAAKIDEDIVRRDSLHAIINSLPDPNYATLRTLVLHLNRVSQNSAHTRMTTSNLAIVFGPTLMGGHGGRPSGEIKDAGWQARVVETILNNALQIFDDDD